VVSLGQLRQSAGVDLQKLEGGGGVAVGVFIPEFLALCYKGCTTLQG
jgi:hypothetical protein